MTEETDEQKQAALAEQKAKEEAEAQERDKKGRFQPKIPEKKAPKAPAETPTPPTDDPLLTDIENDLLKKLGKKVDPKAFEEFDQRTRIKIYRTLDRTDPDPKGEGLDPANPPPLQAKEPKTLAEMNNMVDFMHDVQKSHSMLNMTNKIRGK